MVSSVKANHSPPKLYRFFSTRRFGSSLFTLDRDGFSDKSSFQDYLLNLSSSSATLGQMLSVLWPIRHPEVQPGGGGDRVVVVGSAVRNCSPGLQTIQKVDDVTYGKWKTLSQITHTLRQPKRRPTQKKRQPVHRPCHFKSTPSSLSFWVTFRRRLPIFGWSFTFTKSKSFKLRIHI